MVFTAKETPSFFEVYTVLCKHNQLLKLCSVVCFSFLVRNYAYYCV